jgi:hypothetical protein
VKRSDPEEKKRRDQNLGWREGMIYTLRKRIPRMLPYTSFLPVSSSSGALVA